MRDPSISEDGEQSFTPTAWNANSMSKDTFDSVVEHIEPEEAQSWPPEISKTLRALSAEESLKRLRDIRNFSKPSHPMMKRLNANQRSAIERWTRPGSQSCAVEEAKPRRVTENLDATVPCWF